MNIHLPEHEKTPVLQSALDALLVDITDVLVADVTVEFLSPGAMSARGFVFADGARAWGWTKGRTVYVNDSLSPTKTRYAFLQLLAYLIDHDELDPEKRDQIKQWMEPPARGIGWNSGPYRRRPSTVAADAAVRALTPDDDPAHGLLDDFFQRRIPDERIDEFRAMVVGKTTT